MNDDTSLLGQANDNQADIAAGSPAPYTPPTALAAREMAQAIGRERITPDDDLHTRRLKLVRAEMVMSGD